MEFSVNSKEKAPQPPPTQWTNLLINLIIKSDFNLTLNQKRWPLETFSTSKCNKKQTRKHYYTVMTLILPIKLLQTDKAFL